jgi:uncharacterized membrane protein YccF (DUF307 family)
MRIFLNILWFVLGGWAMGLVWLLAALIMAITIIGLPWARACWEIGILSFAPFGREAVWVSDLRHPNSGMSFLRLLGNVLWFPLGLVLAIGHITHGVAMFVTIIGIPFALQDLKLAELSLFPVGRRVVNQEEAEAARVAGR